MKRIEISRLKSITSLIFELPPPGVYLLAGHNGAGKSTLLACLLRLGDGSAFPRFFRTSPISEQVDQFDKAQIKYAVDSDEVTYSYSGQRWIPQPKRNSEVLNKFGYGEVLFIAADAKRIEPRPEDFRPGRVKDAPTQIRKAAQEIFGQAKYEHLKTINVRRGVGAQAFLFLEQASGSGSQRYFSERNFALGELCVLKLLRDVTSCPNGALLLIDELELALHPKAQVGLVRYLEAITKDKGLTVLFSTHSPTLIRAVRRNQIFFISVEGDQHKCIKGCYPAFALGQIATQTETSPDLVLYVEDDFAKSIVEALLVLLLEAEFADKPRPTTILVPVGAFSAVIQFLARAEGVFPSSTRQFALLDADVKSETLAQLQASKNYSALADFQRVESRLGYLPWTPELGICLSLNSDKDKSDRELRTFFSEPRIDLQNIDLASIASQSGAPARKAAKQQLGRLIDQIAKLKIWEQRKVLDGIAQFFAKRQLDDLASRQKIYELLMPKLNS
jgi:energy-coupling factor transporter ATP-binding protein EcfA2